MDIYCDCGSKTGLLSFEDSNHFAALRCSDCNEFISWLPSPDGLEQTLQKLIDKNTPNKYGKGKEHEKC